MPKLAAVKTLFTPERRVLRRNGEQLALAQIGQQPLANNARPIQHIDLQGGQDIAHQADMENHAEGSHLRWRGLKAFAGSSEPPCIWTPRFKEDLTGHPVMPWLEGGAAAALCGGLAAGAFIVAACDLRPNVRIRTDGSAFYIILGILICPLVLIITSIPAVLYAPPAIRWLASRPMRAINESHRTAHILWHGELRAPAHKALVAENYIRDPRSGGLLNLANKNLREVPLLPAGFREINLADNNLHDLQPEAFSNLIRVRNRLGAQGVSIDLRNNQIREVPELLLELHPSSEVNLQQNPLSRETIEQFEEKIRMQLLVRRTPSFVFPAPEAPEEAPRVVGDLVEGRALHRPNAHDDRVVSSFLLFLRKLATKHPDQFGTHIEPDFDQLSAAVIADMASCTQRHSKKTNLLAKVTSRTAQNLREMKEVASAQTKSWQAPPDISASQDKYDLAVAAVETMINLGRHKIQATDFEPYTTGQILFGVYSFIAAQPSEESRDTGLLWLMNQLSLARNDDGQHTARCNTRHCEEALYALQLAYSHLFDKKVLSLPFETARNIMVEQSKALLCDPERNIAPDIAGQLYFKDLLTREMRQREDIATEHVEQFLTTYVDADWEAFVEMVHDAQSEAAA